jgi:hypothetical protein
VLHECIHSASLAISARRSSLEEATRPSLLSPHHQWTEQNSLEERQQQCSQSIREGEIGMYHYPKIPESKLHSKGEMYFESMDITGSSEGTAANPKFSLLKHWKEMELPKLDAAAQKIQTTTGKCVVICYQWDRARPHVNKCLVEWIQDKFDKRGWILIPQPPNSKDVTAEQGLINGSYVFEGEQLWQYVKRVWEKMKLSTIARTAEGIVNAIVKCKGNDNFAKDQKGLHCGIHKMCIPYYESEKQEQPSGVEVFESNDPVDARSLKYKTPDVSGYSSEDITKLLSHQELEVIMDDSPTDCPEWQQYSVAHLEGSVPSSKIIRDKVK